MSKLIDQHERRALMSLAMKAAMAAGRGATHEQRDYARFAVCLLQAAIGEPITLAEAQRILERGSLCGTPFEEGVSQAILAIKARRELLGDLSLDRGAS
jgi:hypothetical protein